MKQIDAALNVLQGVLPDAAFTVLRQSTQSAFRIRRGTDEAVLELRFGASGRGPTRERPLLLILHNSSAEVRDSLRAAGTCFVDLSGPTFLNLPFLLVDRDRPVPVLRSDRRQFTATTEQVVQTLLMAPDKAWATRALARAASVSPAAVSRSIRELRNLDLVLDRGTGGTSPSRIVVPNRERLLRAWAEQSHWTDHRRLDLIAPVGSASRWLKRIGKQLDRRWALTIHAAARLYAPHASVSDIHMYIDVNQDEQLWELASVVGGEPTSSGGNIHLMIPRNPKTVWPHVQDHDGLPVVEPHRLVVDLWNYPVRGREQAEHIIETVLRRLWKGNGTR